MNIGLLINLQFSMYCLMAVGMLLSKRNLLTESNENFISNLLMKFILPCSIAKSFLVELDKTILQSFTDVLIIACIAALIQVLLGKIVFCKLPKEQRKVMCYGMINPNNAFIALPIIEGLFGEQGLAYAAVYMIPVRITIWTIGLAVFSAQGVSGRQLLKKCGLHPCMVALYIGVSCMITQLQMPKFLYDALKFSSNCLTALSMLLIGAILSRISIRDGVKKEVLYFCLIRLIIAPALLLLACLALRVDGMTREICVFMAAMPAASLTAVLAKQYQSDAGTAGCIVMLSTALETLTLPLWGLVLRLL